MRSSVDSEWPGELNRSVTDSTPVHVAASQHLVKGPVGVDPFNCAVRDAVGVRGKRIERIRNIAPRTEELVVYMPTLKRNSFFAEFFDHLCRETALVTTRLPIHLRQSELTGGVLVDNLEKVLTEVAEDEVPVP